MTAEITTKAKYLCNLCDCISIGNKGDSVVQSLFQLYPHANCYNSRTATKKAVTGTLQIKGDGKGNRFIINMFAQFYPGHAKYPNDNILKRIEWFNACLEKMLDIPDLETLAFPSDLGISKTSNHSAKYDEMLSDFKKKYYLRHMKLVNIVDYQDKDYFMSHHDQAEQTNYDIPIDVLHTDIPLIYNRKDLSSKDSSVSHPSEDEIMVIRKIDITKLRYVSSAQDNMPSVVKKPPETPKTPSASKIRIPLKTPSPESIHKLTQNFLADDHNDKPVSISKPKIQVKTATPISVQASSSTPISVPVQTPSSVPVQTPSSVPVQTPSSVPVQTPISVPVQTLSSVAPALQQAKIYDKNLSWKVAVSELPINEDWDPIFRDPKMMSILDQLNKAFDQEMETFGDHVEILPQPQELIFNAFNQCSYPPKVIILGQDPYFSNLNEAMGLSFSVPDGVKIPSSLSNIFKELADDIPNFGKPKSGNLTPWTKQGILLLNTALTVRYGQKEAHLKLWTDFTKTLMKLLTEANNDMVFMLWGNHAKSKKDDMYEKGKKQYILEAAHPSGLSASRGFFGCKHFSQCNEHLIKNKKIPINWKL